MSRRWRPGRTRTIATRLLAWFLLMASLPLIVVLLLSSKNRESDLRHDGVKVVVATAGSKADRIEAYAT
ncbi:MAG: hypothetical protein ACRDZ7_13920, partial [Acidimicrobiia bacterium]